MDPQFERHPIAERAFWAASGLAVLGAVGSLIAGAGHTNRVGSVAIPFVIAAGGFAALALMHQRGRGFSTIGYIVAGLAIVYGLLLVLEVPMRLAVEGTCPPAPQRCTSGAEMQLSSSETLALSIAVGFGVMALLAGYFGLVALYRLRRPGTPAASAQVWPSQEPAGWRRRAAKEAEPETESKAESKTEPEAETAKPPDEEPPPG